VVDVQRLLRIELSGRIVGQGSQVEDGINPAEDLRGHPPYISSHEAEGWTSFQMVKCRAEEKAV
jgi:hypothetical protein